jgi:hypothetical protein
MLNRCRGDVDGLSINESVLLGIINRETFVVFGRARIAMLRDLLTVGHASVQAATLALTRCCVVKLFRNLEGFDELRNSLDVVTNFNAESGPVVELLCYKDTGVSFVNNGRHVEM